MNWITQTRRRVQRKLVSGCTTILLTWSAKGALAAEPIEMGLIVPAHLPGCAGDAFFWREFHRALGPNQPLVTTKSRIHVLIEEIEPDTFQLDLRMLPLWTKPVQRVYGPPTECSKVVAYAADIAATMLSATLGNQSTFPSDVHAARSKPTPASPLPLGYLFGGFRVSYGLSPQLVSMSPVVGGGVPLSPAWAVEFSLSMTLPYSWHTTDGRQVDIRFGGSASAALCYQFRRLDLCPKVTLGGYDGQARFLERPSNTLGTYYLTMGMELDKGIQLSATTKLRFGANIAVTTGTPAFQIERERIWTGSRISATLEVGLQTW